MKKSELEQLIWATRRDVLNYILGHTWTIRKVDEASILKQYSCEKLEDLGMTETESELVKENLALKEEIEDLRYRIDVLLKLLLEDKPKLEKLKND